jgi:hypothetical protein
MPYITIGKENSGNVELQNQIHPNVQFVRFIESGIHGHNP